MSATSHKRRSELRRARLAADMLRTDVNFPFDIDVIKGHDLDKLATAFGADRAGRSDDDLRKHLLRVFGG